MWWLLAATALAGTRGAVSDLPPPPDMEAAYAPRRVALVVGIDSYDDPELGGLRYAAKDADDLTAVLSDPSAGGFDVITQLSGEVTADAFWSAFRSVASTLQRDDTFLLYIAAHGTLDLDSGTALYVMPSDGRLDAIAATGVALAELERALGQLKSRRRVLAMDTCHTGQGRSSISAETMARIEQFRGPIPPPIAARVSQSEVRLYSAHFNQPALEDKDLENGVYTHFLIQALRGEGDADGDGLVEALEAHYWARDRTLEHTGGTQVPWMETQLVGREAVFLSGDPAERRDAERALLTGLEALPARARITVDGEARGAGAVEPGRRSVGVTLDERTLVDQTLRIEVGEALDISRLVATRGRRALVELGGDLRPESDWVPSLGGRLSAWHLPVDPGGGRLALGLSGSYGLADLPAGDVFAQAGWWWGDRWLAGPTLSGGLLWRVAPLQIVDDAAVSLLSSDEKEVQSAPALSPGLSLHYNRRAVAGAQLSALIFQTDRGLSAHPQLTLSGGARF